MAALHIKPGDFVCEFEPRAIGALESEAAHKIADAGDGKGFLRGSLVAERVGLDGFAGELERDVDFQRSSKHQAPTSRKHPSPKHQETNDVRPFEVWSLVLHWSLDVGAASFLLIIRGQRRARHAEEL